MLNLETNCVVETCEVTFDETMLSSISVFERAGDEEMGDSIFVEDDDDIDWDDPKPSQPAAPIEPASTTSAHGPYPSSSMTWGPHELPPQPTPAEPEEAPATVEGEATSSMGAPQHIQRRHPP